ncbi:hypothetical protein ABKN59_008684 [Abortiporus biennis]
MSNSMDTSGSFEFPLDQIYIRNYLYLLGIVILYYDYLLTFSDEVRYMWFQPSLRIPWLFFFNRYFSILADIGITIANFVPYTSLESCVRYNTAAEFVLVIVQLLAGIVLLLRTYALYGRSRKILIFILSLTAPLIGFIIWSVFTEETGISSIINGCIITQTPTSELHLAGAWESLIAYDLLIFITIVVKTYKRRAEFRDEQLGRLGSVFVLIWRDGAIYFGVMACANVANSLTFYTLPLSLQASLSRFASSVSVTLISRLMINLRKQSVSRFQSENITGETTDVENATTLSFEMKVTPSNSTATTSSAPSGSGATSSSNSAGGSSTKGRGMISFASASTSAGFGEAVNRNVSSVERGNFMNFQVTIESHRNQRAFYKAQSLPLLGRFQLRP